MYGAGTKVVRPVPDGPGRYQFHRSLPPLCSRFVRLAVSLGRGTGTSTIHGSEALTLPVVTVVPQASR